MRTRAVLSAAAAVVVVGVGVAQAGSGGTTIGSSLSGSGSIGSGPCDRPSGCTVSQVSLGGATTTAPAAGRLTSWKVRGFSGSISLKVISGTGSSSHVTQTTGEERGTGGTDTFTISGGLPIEAGDRIGVGLQRGASWGFFFNSSARTDTWDPPLGTSPAAPTSTDLNSEEITLNATFVPASSGGGGGGSGTSGQTTVSIGGISSLERVTARTQRNILFAFRVFNKGRSEARGVKTCVSLPSGFKFNYARSGNRPRNSTVSGRTLCIRDSSIPVASNEGYVVQANTPRAGRYRVRITVTGTNVTTKRRTVSVNVHRR